MGKDREMKRKRVRDRGREREIERQSVWEREQQMINRLKSIHTSWWSETNKLSLVDLDKDHYIPPIKWKGCMIRLHYLVYYDIKVNNL